MRLALAVGRTDWQNLAKEHTPYELAVWRAYERIEPFGERRADMRMALQTLSLIQSTRTRSMSGSDMKELLSALTNYACPEDAEPEVVTGDQAAMMWGAR
jgi:hypothetical protein